MEMAVKPSELKIGDLLLEIEGSPHGNPQSATVLAVYSLGEGKTKVCYTVGGYEERGLYYDNDHKLPIHRIL